MLEKRAHCGNILGRLVLTLSIFTLSSVAAQEQNEADNAAHISPTYQTHTTMDMSTVNFDSDFINDTDWSSFDEELEKEITLSFSEKLWIAYQIVKWKTKELHNTVQKHMHSNSAVYASIVRGAFLACVSILGGYCLTADKDELIFFEQNRQNRTEQEDNQEKQITEECAMQTRDENNAECETGIAP